MHLRLCVFSSIGHLSIEDIFAAARRFFKLQPPNLTTAQTIAMRAGMKQYLTLLELKINANGLDRPSYYPLTTLLWLFRDRISSDPRDTVYASLGMLDNTSLSVENTKPSGKAGAHPIFDYLIRDYNAPFEEVCASLVKTVVLNAATSFRKVLGTELGGAMLRISLLLKNMSHRQFGLRGAVQQPLHRACASQTASVTFS
jgi:hypothetical protein